MAHAGHGLDLIQVGAHSLPGIHGTLLKNGPEHIRNGEVDAVNRFAADNRRNIHAVNALADDLEILGVFQLHLGEFRRRHRRDFGGKFAVTERAI